MEQPCHCKNQMEQSCHEDLTSHLLFSHLFHTQFSHLLFGMCLLGTVHSAELPAFSLAGKLATLSDRGEAEVQPISPQRQIRP